MELKDVVKEHLVNENEKEITKKIKENSKLKKITFFNNGTPYGNHIKDILSKEGINLIEKTSHKDISKASSIVNYNMFPIIYVNNTYLAYQRDFNNPQQLISIIKSIAHPDFNNVQDKNKQIEHMKTANFLLYRKIDQLEKLITPVVNLLTKLTEELEEDNE